MKELLDWSGEINELLSAAGMPMIDLEEDGTITIHSEDGGTRWIGTLVETRVDDGEEPTAMRTTPSGPIAAAPSAVATIYHAEGVRFRDTQALDEELMEPDGNVLHGLYGGRTDQLPEWNGPFVFDADGELLIADADSTDRVRYGSATRVDDKWRLDVTDTISRHLVAGELVIEIMEEGQGAEYVVITPGAFDVRDHYR